MTFTQTRHHISIPLRPLVSPDDVGIKSSEVRPDPRLGSQIQTPLLRNHIIICILYCASTWFMVLHPILRSTFTSIHHVSHPRHQVRTRWRKRTPPHGSDLTHVLTIIPSADCIAVRSDGELVNSDPPNNYLPRNHISGVLIQVGSVLSTSDNIAESRRFQL